MITIPEGMGLESFGLAESFGGMEGVRKTIKKVRYGKAKKRPFVAPAYGLKVAKNREEYRRMKKAGLIPPDRVYIPEMDIKEKESRSKYVRIKPYAESIVEDPEEVRVVDFNRVEPVRSSRDIMPVRGKVLEPTPVPVDEGEGIDILPEEGEVFNAETEDRVVPGLPDEPPPFPTAPSGSLHQPMPKRIRMQGPDKLIYEGAPEDAMTSEVEEKTHEEVEAMGGIYRVSEGTPIEDVGIIDIIAAVASSAATGFSIYKDIQARKDIKRAEKKEASAAAARSAAEFDKMFSAQVTSQYGRQPAPGPAGPALAPLAAGEGFPWKWVLIGVGGVAVVGLAVYLATR